MCREQAPYGVRSISTQVGKYSCPYALLSLWLWNFGLLFVFWRNFLPCIIFWWGITVLIAFDVFFIQLEIGWRVWKIFKRLQRQWRWLQPLSYEQFKLELKIPVDCGSLLLYFLVTLPVCFSTCFYHFYTPGKFHVNEG